MNSSIQFDYKKNLYLNIECEHTEQNLIRNLRWLHGRTVFTASFHSHTNQWSAAEPIQKSLRSIFSWDRMHRGAKIDPIGLWRLLNVQFRVFRVFVGTTKSQASRESRRRQQQERCSPKIRCANLFQSDWGARVHAQSIRWFLINWSALVGVHRNTKYCRVWLRICDGVSASHLNLKISNSPNRHEAMEKKASSTDFRFKVEWVLDFCSPRIRVLVVRRAR